MTLLSVNLNKIALIRNSRDTTIPDVVAHAQLCIDAGADGITVHPRPDQRHIRVDDCDAIAKAIKVEFNIEGNPFAPARPSDRRGVSDYPGFMALVERIRPAQATLVPDGDSQLTSDHGFDLSQDAERLAPIIATLKDWGCRVSLFMDPKPQDMVIAREIGADRVELYTEAYAAAHASGDYVTVLKRYQAAAEAANKVGLGINAGHDLNLHNLPDFAIENLLEVSIGHALVVDALSMGLAATVARYKAALIKRG